jgi:FtsZ-binding cell division protein ZapB
MIKAKDGEVTFRGTRSNIMAEAVTVLHALKEELSEEEYKMVIRLADKSREQLSDEAKKMREETERMKEELKKLLGLWEV